MSSGAESQATPAKSRVWVLDDDTELLQLLQERLLSCGWQVQTFERPDGLRSALQQVMPHVLLLNRRLPGAEGLKLLQELRGSGYRFAVLMLSVLAEPEQRIEGLECGADDYLAKPFLWRELQLRLQRLLEYQQLRPPQKVPELEIFRIDGLRFEPAQLRLQGPEGQEANLSRGDASLLGFFCLGPGLTFERDQLLQATGSLVNSRSSRSLDVRISKLRKLLDQCHPGAGSLIESVRGRGYRLQASVQRGVG
jgi:DNA-binding response OmpR family regulator